MFKLKALAVAVALTAAGAANAAFTEDVNTGNSSLVFSAWNGSTSYSRDLGLHYSDFAGQSVAQVFTTIGQVWTADAAYTSAFGLGGPTAWTVAAGDNVTIGGTNGIVVSMSNATAPTVNKNSVNNALGGMGTKWGSMATAAGVNSSFSVAAGTAAAWDIYNTPGFAATGVPSIANAVGATSYLWLLNPNGSGVAQATKTLNTVNSFSLAANGTLTLNPVSEVPLPAAAWLFGSGLLGLVGIARRRKA